jgi:hypothetical protein
MGKYLEVTKNEGRVALASLPGRTLGLVMLTDAALKYPKKPSL